MKWSKAIGMFWLVMGSTFGCKFISSIFVGENVDWRSLFTAVVAIWLYWKDTYTAKQRKEPFIVRLVAAPVIIFWLGWSSYKVALMGLEYFSKGQPILGILLIPATLVLSFFCLSLIKSAKAYVVNGKYNN